MATFPSREQTNTPRGTLAHPPSAPHAMHQQPPPLSSWEGLVVSMVGHYRKQIPFGKAITAAFDPPQTLLRQKEILEEPMGPWATTCSISAASNRPIRNRVPSRPISKACGNLMTILVVRMRFWKSLKQRRPTSTTSSK